jgi:hypothetical protein
MTSTTIRAKTSFAFTDDDGAPVTIIEGETFQPGAKRLKGISDETLEANFEPFTPDHRVEQATAAPGEKRGATSKK